MAQAKKAEPVKINSSRPVVPRDFGLAEHRYRQFDALVDNSTTREQLVTSPLWTNIAPQLIEGDEVRVMDFNRTFCATLICTFSVGTTVVMHEKDYTELDAIRPSAEDDPIGKDYQVERRPGTDGWCVIQQSTGDMISSSHASQAAAMKSREEHLSVLRR